MSVLSKFYYPPLTLVENWRKLYALDHNARHFLRMNDADLLTRLCSGAGGVGHCWQVADPELEEGYWGKYQ